MGKKHSEVDTTNRSLPTGVVSGPVRVIGPMIHLTVGGLLDGPRGGLHFFPRPSRSLRRLKQVDGLAQPQDLLVCVAEL